MHISLSLYIFLMYVCEYAYIHVYTHVNWYCSVYAHICKYISVCISDINIIILSASVLTDIKQLMAIMRLSTVGTHTADQAMLMIT